MCHPNGTVLVLSFYFIITSHPHDSIFRVLCACRLTCLSVSNNPKADMLMPNAYIHSDYFTSQTCQLFSVLRKERNTFRALKMKELGEEKKIVLVVDKVSLQCYCNCVFFILLVIMITEITVFISSYYKVTIKPSIKFRSS